MADINTIVYYIFGIVIYLLYLCNVKLKLTTMSKLKHLYIINKTKKVGELCDCPSCKTSFIKEHYQQTFCKSIGGTVCKDYYWNHVTPTKRNNTTRISPANARYYANHIEPYKKDIDYDDDLSWDAHKLY